LTRWFADLPIERKLRIVITVPAMAAFAIAMIMYIATNLLHLRADMQQRAAGIARAAGVSTIEALRSGDTTAAISALNALRDEPMVNIAEVYLADGQKLATYDRAANEVQLERQAPDKRFDPGNSRFVVRGNQFQITVPATRDAPSRASETQSDSSQKAPAGSRDSILPRHA